MAWFRLVASCRRSRSGSQPGLAERDAEPEWSTGRALAAGASDDEIADVLLAIASVTGLARIVSAAPEAAIALGYDTQAALLEQDDQYPTHPQGRAPCRPASQGATFLKVAAGYAERLAEVDGRLSLSGPDPHLAEQLRHTGRLKDTERIFEATPLVSESTEGARHAAQERLVDKQPE